MQGKIFFYKGMRYNAMTAPHPRVCTIFNFFFWVIISFLLMINFQHPLVTKVVWWAGSLKGYCFLNGEPHALSNYIYCLLTAEPTWSIEYLEILGIFWNIGQYFKILCNMLKYISQYILFWNARQYLEILGHILN